MHSRTFRLFPMPSGWTGLARLLDIGVTFNKFNVDVSGQVADANAIRGDWAMVGSDLAATMLVVHESSRLKDLQAEADRLTEAWRAYVVDGPDTTDTGTQLSLRDA